MTRVSPASSDSGTKVGLLSRSLQVRPTKGFSRSMGNCSVLTLHHWASPEATQSSSTSNGSNLSTRIRRRQEPSVFAFNRERDRSRILDHARSQFALIRVQETALNFLFRWLLLDEIDDNEDEDCSSDTKDWPSLDSSNFEQGICSVLDLHRNSLPEQLVPRNEIDDSLSQTSSNTLKSKSQPIVQVTRKSTSDAFHEQIRSQHHHENPIDLILKDLPKLSNCHWTTVVRYVFWRWLTWANVFEFVLIILLMCCCAYQCYELLEEYYRYPTHVSVLSVMHDDFRTDLPAVTLCDNSRISLDVLRRDFPEYNASHFLAISMGTFYSLNNFTLDMEKLKVFDANQLYDDITTHFVDSNNDDISSDTNITKFISSLSIRKEKPKRKSPFPLEIDWVRVVQFLSNGTVSGFMKLLPRQSLVENLVCSNIWGEKMPCNKLRTLRSVQLRGSCETLFHDSAMYDSREPAVKELEETSRKRPATIVFGDKSSDGSGLLPISGSSSEEEKSSWSFLSSGEEEISSVKDIDKPSSFSQRNKELVDRLNSNNQLFATNEEEEAELERNKGDFRIEMVSKEVVRLRLNFHGEDYANTRNVVGAKFTIHSNSQIGEISHKSFRILPGHWYAYYIDRFDYRRLPPPYDSGCYDYTMTSRYNWLDRIEWFKGYKSRALELTREQVRNLKKPIPEFVSMIRRRSLSRVSSKSTS